MSTILRDSGDPRLFDLEECLRKVKICAELNESVPICPINWTGNNVVAIKDPTSSILSTLQQITIPHILQWTRTSSSNALGQYGGGLNTNEEGLRYRGELPFATEWRPVQAVTDDGAVKDGLLRHKLEVVWTPDTSVPLMSDLHYWESRRLHCYMKGDYPEISTRVASPMGTSTIPVGSVNVQMAAASAQDAGFVYGSLPIFLASEVMSCEAVDETYQRVMTQDRLYIPVPHDMDYATAVLTVAIPSLRAAYDEGKAFVYREPEDTNPEPDQWQLAIVGQATQQVDLIEEGEVIRSVTGMIHLSRDIWDGSEMEDISASIQDHPDSLRIGRVPGLGSQIADLEMTFDHEMPIDPDNNARDTDEPHPAIKRFYRVNAESLGLEDGTFSWAEAARGATGWNAGGIIFELGVSLDGGDGSSGTVVYQRENEAPGVVSRLDHLNWAVNFVVTEDRDVAARSEDDADTEMDEPTTEGEIDLMSGLQRI
jgi:hypothetical protein